MNPRPEVAPGGAFQLLLLLVLLIPAIIFLISQQNALKSIRPENRLMQPGLVWLQLIPLFGNFWQFFVVRRIAGSFRRELVSGNSDSIFGADALLADGGSAWPTRSIGVAYCILDSIAVFFALIPLKNTLLQGLIGWAMMICWIIYWVKLTQYKNKLKRLTA